MSDIPGARRQIFKIAEELETGSSSPKEVAARLRDLSNNELVRRSPARRMEQKSNPVTPEIKDRIIELADNTALHSADIAAKVGVNPGRVSEILQGDK